MNDSTFNRADLEASIGTLLDDATPAARRIEIEAELAASATGRAALAEIESLARLSEPSELGAPATVDVTEGVLRRLPPGPPGLYRGIADLVAQAWADPDWREVLRRDPRAALAARGIHVPAAMPIIVTDPTADASTAALPTGDALGLPLPPAGQAAIPIAEARRILGHTEFGWLWGPPWVEVAAGTASVPPTVESVQSTAPAPSAQAAPSAAPPVPTAAGRMGGVRAGQERSRWRRLGSPRLKLGLAFTGALAIVLLLVVVSPMLDEGTVGGTALGSATGLEPWLLAAAAALGIGIYVAWRQRR